MTSEVVYVVIGTGDGVVAIVVVVVDMGDGVVTGHVVLDSLSVRTLYTTRKLEEPHVTIYVVV